MTGRRRKRRKGGRNFWGGRTTYGVKKVYIPRKMRRRRPNLRLGGFIGLESKFRDDELTVTAVPTTWTALNPTTANCLNGIGQGDTESLRDGRVYHITSVHLRCIVQVIVAESATAPHADVYGRMLLVLDTQTNGAEMSAADCMISDQTYDALAYRNLENTSRFKILRNRKWNLHVFDMNEGASNLFSLAGTVSPVWEWDVKFNPPLKVTVAGTGATVSSIKDNSLHFLICANTGGCEISYETRLRFKG